MLQSQITNCGCHTLQVVIPEITLPRWHLSEDGAILTKMFILKRDKQTAKGARRKENHLAIKRTMHKQNLLYSASTVTVFHKKKPSFTVSQFHTNIWDEF